MKVAFYSILICMLVLLIGCSTNPLVSNFRDRGVTPATTAKLKFIGSADDFGENASVMTDEQHVIKAVWKSIYSATPAAPYGGHDFGKIEFYTSKKVEWPAAILLVNASAASFLDTEFHRQYKNGRYVGLMRCPGLDKLIKGQFEKQYQKPKDSSQHSGHIQIPERRNGDHI